MSEDGKVDDTAENDAGRQDPHIVQVEKIHEAKWQRGIFDFLVKYSASMMPPYPSTVAMLRTGDRGHAEAYAKAINQHVEKHAPGGYRVTVYALCEIEPTRVTPPA